MASPWPIQSIEMFGIERLGARWLAIDKAELSDGYCSPPDHGIEDNSVELNWNLYTLKLIDSPSRCQMEMCLKFI